MVSKIKKVVMPLVVGAFLFGGVSGNFGTVEDVSVYANTQQVESRNTQESTTGKIPVVSMDGNGGLNLGGLETADKGKVYDEALSEFRTAVLFVSGIGTICMILFFILNFINLGKSQGNPSERQKAISGLILTGIATAGLGSVWLITSLFFNML